MKHVRNRRDYFAGLVDAFVDAQTNGAEPEVIKLALLQTLCAVHDEIVDECGAVVSAALGEEGVITDWRSRLETVLAAIHNRRLRGDLSNV